MKRKDSWVTKRSVAQKVRAQVLERDGYRCQLRFPGCLELATEVDHIVPRAAGGAIFDAANLRAVCRRCHDRRPPVKPRDDPCRIWPHVPPNELCPRCGALGPSRDW